MKLILVLSIYISILVPVTKAQESVSVELTTVYLSADSLDVLVGIGGELGDLSRPVWAFQFEIRSDSTLKFLGSDQKFMNTDRSGWTVASNVQNGRVGGFSSSMDAVTMAGAIVALRFKRTSIRSESRLCLYNLVLNTGDPFPVPELPCIIVERNSTE